MDLLRSCYSTKMRFFRDDPTEIDVRWYWADADAKIFPAHTLFASGNWASERYGWDGPGEVLGAPRVYDKGEFIDGMAGQHFCGPLAGYMEGVTYPGVPLEGLPDGRCACCAPVDVPPCAAVFPAYDNTINMTATLVSSTLATPIYDPLQLPFFGYRSGLESWNMLPFFGQWFVPAPCPALVSLLLFCNGDLPTLGSFSPLPNLQLPDEYDPHTQKLTWHAFEIIAQTDCAIANGMSEKWRIEIYPT